MRDRELVVGSREKHIVGSLLASRPVALSSL
jgi:hypothetical protein